MTKARWHARHMTVSWCMRVPPVSLVLDSTQSRGATILQRGISRRSVVRSVCNRAAARPRLQRLVSSVRRSPCFSFAAETEARYLFVGRTSPVCLPTTELGEASGSMAPPREQTIACSGTFSNCRTLPGQSWSMRANMARRDPDTPLPYLVAENSISTRGSVSSHEANPVSQQNHTASGCSR